MSLSEAMLELADEIEADSRSDKDAGGMVAPLLRSYARTIRAAVKACAGQEAPAVPDNIQKARRIEAAALARRQADEAARADDLRENRAPRMTVCVGGNADGLMVNLDPGMPTNARTQIDGTVYRLGTDGKLHAEKLGADSV